MAHDKAPTLSGRDIYSRIYLNELEVEAKWLDIGARRKVDSIQLLLERNGVRPVTLLELGCGTGAVIRECQRRGLAERYVGMDYSEEAIAYLLGHSTGISAVAADVTVPDALAGLSADVVILSHVLEHLEDPTSVLRALNGLRCSHAVLEVPLEDLPIGRIKSWVRTRVPNHAGHVQFYSGGSFEALVRDCGLVILDRWRYTPVLDAADMAFLRAKSGHGWLRHLQTWITANFLPRLLGAAWSRSYYAHYTVLCRPGPDPA